MQKKNDTKGADLIEEGTFGNGLGGAWKKGEPPHDGAAIGKPDYQGGTITTGRMQSDDWLEQFFDLPTPRGPDAKYELTFVYQTSKRNSWYRIARNGIWGGEIPLVWDGSLEDPEPLEFVPTPGELDLEPTESDTTLGLRFGYPFVPPTDSGTRDVTKQGGTLDVTNVSVRLYLGSLVLSGLQLDDEAFVGTPFLHVCRGATGPSAHRVKLVVTEGNVWAGTDVSLQKEVVGPPPPGLEIQPGLGELQMIEKEWEVSVPDSLPNDEFKLLVKSKWHSEPEPLELLFNIGDHRVRVDEELGLDYDPIVNKQTVTIGVKVISHYTYKDIAERAMTFDGEHRESNERGEAFYDYSPTTAGLQQVKVLIDSRYYEEGTYEHSLNVKVLASDPWDDAQIALGGGGAFPLGEKKGYPHRGEPEYTIRVTAPVDSELLNYPVKLKWEGRPADQFDVVVTPPLTEYVDWVDNEVTWTLNCTNASNDEDFKVSLQAERLLESSEQNTLSLAHNRFEVGGREEANRFPVVDENESVRVKLQLLAAGTTVGVRNVAVVWETPTGPITTRTGLEGWTELNYKPERAGSDTLVARVSNRDDNEDAQIEELFNFTALQSNAWKAHVRLVLQPDNQIFPTGPLDFYCHRGSALTLKMMPEPGSKLLNQKVGLRWRGEDSGLGLTFSPPLDQTSILSSEGLTWTMTADTEHSGWLELDFYTEFVDIPQDLELTGRLISLNLLVEGVVDLDSLAVPVTPASKFYPCIGAEHVFRFTPNPQAALSGLHLQLWVKPQTVDPRTLGIEFHPNLETDVLVTSQGAQWDMDCLKCESTASFELDMKLSAGNKSLSSTSDFLMAVGHNRLEFTQSREPSIFPVIELHEAAYVWHRVCSYYTKEPVGGVPVTFSHPGGELVVPSRADGWAAYAVEPAALEDNVVEARLHNRYNDESVKIQSTVDAVQSEPWGDMWFYDTNDDFEKSKLGQQTQFPRRPKRSIYQIAPAVVLHPTEGHKVRLGWTGTGAQELDVEIHPRLGSPEEMPEGGVGQVCNLNFSGKQDGSFNVFIAGEKLLTLSPANPMSLGNHSSETGAEP